MNKVWILVGLMVVGQAWGYGGEGYGDEDYGDEGFRDRARVLSVTPIIEEVRVPERRRECYDEEVVVRHRPDYGAPILGGIIGGVLGNQVGRHHGRGAATVAGALLGATVGSAINHRNRGRRVDTVRRCHLVNEYHREERVSGYRVKYRYRGNTFVTRMDHDPGAEVDVQVDVEAFD